MSVVCCQIEVSATSRSLDERSPTDCVCVCPCDQVQIQLIRRRSQIKKVRKEN